MIRLIEDIIPPDRPEETPPPKVMRAYPPQDSQPEEPQTAPAPRIHHELFDRETREETRAIAEPPPFISRIPTRDEVRNTSFLDRKPKERTPLSVETDSKGLFQVIRRHALPALAVVCVLAYVALSLTVFFRAKIIVTPKSERVVLNSHLTAGKDAATGLSFSVFSVTATETKDVLATETKNVNTKSSGKIVVYNEYSASSQRLIKNTRFQAANGKIYRISESIVVPGVATVGGKKVPGSIEVTVYADEPGAEYNIPLTDFTVPGFKGDPRYNKFYARSKTPMTGGFAGEMRVVADADLATAREEIEKNLSNRLRTEARNAVPEEFVLFDEGMFIVTKPLSRTDVEGNEQAVRLEEVSTLQAVMFPRALLASALAKDAVPNYDGSPVSVPDLDLLKIAIVPKDESAWLENELHITVSGDSTIVWNVNAEELVADLLGKKRSVFAEVLAKIPSINEAEVEFRPAWWRGKFPGNKERILVVVKGVDVSTAAQ